MSSTTSHFEFDNQTIYPIKLLICYDYENYKDVLSKFDYSLNNGSFHNVLDKSDVGLFRKLIRNEKGLLNDPSYKWFAIKRIVKNTHVYALFIRNKVEFNHYTYKTIAHECLHICQFALPRILTRDDEYEAEAYYHSFLMDKCIKLIEKINSK